MCSGSIFHAKYKYYVGLNVEVFDCLFDYLQAGKVIKTVKKRKGHTDYYLTGTN